MIWNKQYLSFYPCLPFAYCCWLADAVKRSRPAPQQPRRIPLTQAKRNPPRKPRRNPKAPPIPKAPPTAQKPPRARILRAWRIFLTPRLQPNPPTKAISKAPLTPFLLLCKERLGCAQSKERHKNGEHKKISCVFPKEEKYSSYIIYENDISDSFENLKWYLPVSLPLSCQWRQFKKKFHIPRTARISLWRNQNIAFRRRWNISLQCRACYLCAKYQKENRIPFGKTCSEQRTWNIIFIF